MKNDNVQASDTKRDEVLSAITHRPTDSTLENLYKMQIEKLEELKYLWQVYAQETTVGDKKFDKCRFKLMTKRHLEETVKDAH